MSTRDEIRAQILGAQSVAKVAVDFYGTQIELRQATVGEMQQMITDNQANGSTTSGLIGYLIAYAYVPGTDEKVFDATDIDVLNQLPFDNSMKNLTDAINSLTNITVADAEKN